MQWSTVAIFLSVCAFYTREDSGTGSVEAVETSWGAEEKLSCVDTWFVPENGSCVCGNTFDGIISCDEYTKEVEVEDCYCITLDYTSTRNTTRPVMGQCSFNCVNVTKSYSDYIYHHVPRELVSGDDNNSVCGYLHRDRTLCGRCEDGYYMAAYSYTFECIHCHQAKYIPNWLWYVLVAYLPLTIFIIIILVFRVSVVSPKLYGVIIIVQNVTSPLNIRILVEAVKHDYTLNIIYQVMTSLMSIWNLDFFRTLLPGICLQIDTLKVLALDYLIAVYPMTVTVVAFVILELHNRGFKPVMCICRPFYRVFARFRKDWNLRTSLIDAFVTFFVLSTTKLLFVSVNLLVYSNLYTPHGEIVGTCLYEDASVEYFGPKHTPFGALAVMVIFFLMILPVCLLVFYESKCFQRCLIKTRLKNRVLEDLVYSFNQYYKDGSDGSMDCRWFAAFHIAARMSVIALLFLPITALYFNFLLIYVLVCSIFMVAVEPYRAEYRLYNSVEPCLCLLLAGFLAGITGINAANLLNRESVHWLFVTTAVNGLLPLLYLFVVSTWWILQRTQCNFRMGSKDISPDLPDRLLNSDQYGSLSSTHSIQ